MLSEQFDGTPQPKKLSTPEDTLETNPILKRISEVLAFHIMYPHHQQYINTHPNAKINLMKKRKERYEIWKKSNDQFPIRTKGQ